MSVDSQLAAPLEMTWGSERESPEHVLVHSIGMSTDGLCTGSDQGLRQRTYGYRS